MDYKSKLILSFEQQICNSLLFLDNESSQTKNNQEEKCLKENTHKKHIYFDDSDQEEKETGEISDDIILITDEKASMDSFVSE